MANLAKRLFLDALLAFLFYRFSRFVMTVVLIIAAIFLYGVISSNASDLRAHGMGDRVDPSAVTLNYSVNEMTSEVYWTVKNTSNRVVGDIEVTCRGNGVDYAFLVGDYVAAGQEIAGSKYQSIFGYDTVCSVSSVTAYDR